MKKLLSVMMILLILMSITVFGASALDSAKTVVSVKKGDDVVYSLKLTVPEKVVGCDFSIYYDSSVLRVKEVADFTGNYDSEEYMALINSNLKDQIVGNWSILSGIPFDNRSFCSVKFEAIQDGDTHVSYYVRDMYPESLEQFTEYNFTCDVAVNKKTVIDNKAPELNVEEQQPHGGFTNSVTGDGDDANVNMADSPVVNSNDSNGGELSEDNAQVNNADNNNNSNSTSSTVNNNKVEETKADATEKKADDTKAEEETDETTVSAVGATDSSEVTAISVASPSQTDDNGSIFTSVWFWIMIAAILIGGGAYAYYFLKVKKAPKTEDNKTEE